MRTRLLPLLLLAVPFAVHAQQDRRDSPFLAFAAETPAAARLPASTIAKQKFEIVVATRATQFSEMARAGSSRLAECTIPQALPAGKSRDR